MKNKKGFTLIELLVVIAIIGLLSTLAVVSLNGARSKARDARRTSDLKALQSAVELYIADNESAPTLPATWTALGTTLASYLPAGTPTDPGSNDYVYCVDSASGSDTYLVGGVLESSDAIAGDLDGAVTSYAVTECMVSDDANPSATINCTDTTGGNLDGAQTTTVFCLGSL